MASLQHAASARGSIHVPANSTVFITKFCFTFDPAPSGSVGKLNVTLWAPSLSRHQRAHLVMFDDEAESFPGPSGQWDALSCAERVKHAKNKVRLDWTKKKAAHPFARILMAGIVLSFVAAVLSCGHFFLYMVNGVGAPLVRVAAQLLCGASRFVLASLLLLLSEGKCVSYVMTAADARRVGRLLGPFFVFCVFLELWGDHSVSRRYTTDYVYTTPFGWTIILVNVLLLARYASNLWQTHARERDHNDGMFYRRWGLVYGAWFLALPTTAMLSQAILAPYVWYIVSVCVNGAMTAFVYAALVVGLWPGNKRTFLKLHAPLLPEEALEGCVRSLYGYEAAAAAEVSKDLSPPARLPSLLGSTAQHGYRCAKLGYYAQP